MISGLGGTQKSIHFETGKQKQTIKVDFVVINTRTAPKPIPEKNRSTPNYLAQILHLEFRKSNQNERSEPI